MTEQQIAILKKCLETWGKYAQVVMMFEETAELNKELCKSLRGRDNTAEILDEIADVMIMLQEMMILFDINPDHLQQRIAFKFDRIVSRLEQSKGAPY